MLKLKENKKIFLISLALVILSMYYTLLVNWKDLSLRIVKNPAFLEAQSLLGGNIALRERVHDTALYRGKVYNVFQPGQTLFFLVHLAFGNDNALSLFQAEIFFLFLLSVFFFCAALYRLAKGRRLLPVLLAVSIMFGAPYITNLQQAIYGHVARVNNHFVFFFVAVFLYLVSFPHQQQNYLLIGTSIGAAMVFRAQNILLLILPLSQLLQDVKGDAWHIKSALASPPVRKKLMVHIATLLVVPVLAALTIAAFQMARFGNPLETGYMYLYQGRDDVISQNAKEHGLYSIQFLGSNVRQTLFAFPRLRFAGWQITEIIGDARGNSLLYSQPILLTGCLMLKSHRKARVHSFLILSMLMTIPVLLYHNPGYYAPGYMRLSLDYLPLWISTLAVASRETEHGKVLGIPTLLCALWAVLYGLALLTVQVSV